MPELSTVKTRILIISDTHSHDLFPSTSRNHAFRDPMPTADVLLHCGDLTYRGGLDEYEKTLGMLGKIQAELKLVIAGNHDISLHPEYYRKHYPGSMGVDDVPTRALEMWKGERARKAGVTYLEEGLSTFRLKSGAQFTVYASPYQPEFCGWAFAYKRNEDRFNPADVVPKNVKSIVENPIPGFLDVDIVMTHGPPKDHLDFTVSGQRAGCPHLWRAIQRAKPRLHCFGHIHEGWGAQRVRWSTDSSESPSKDGLVKTVEVDADLDQALQDRSAYVDVSNTSDNPLKHGEETLIINGSILTARYIPNQAPWLVDLELPMSA